MIWSICNSLQRYSLFSLFVYLVVLFSLCSCSTKYVVEHTPREIIPDTTKIDTTPRKIALLVPLSGTYSNLGNDILEACMLATRSSKNNVEVIVIDSEKIKHSLHNVIEIIRKNRVDHVIGPVFGTDAKAISEEMPDVSFFSLSNDKRIANKNVIVFGIDPEQEITTLFEHSIKLGRRNILAFIPNNRYGEAISRAIDAADMKDSQVKKIRYNSITEVSVGELIKESNFDTVFSVNAQYIPSGLDKDALVLLPYNKQNTSDNRLNNALICAPNQQSKKLFEQDFLNNYGHIPEEISMIAFDVTTVAIDAASNDGGILNVFNKTYGGVFGDFIVNEDGSVTRDLRVYKNVH